MPLKWRVILILGLTVVAAVSVWPPQESIKLGLDLKGGIHLLIAVDTDDAVKAELDNAASSAVRALDKAGVAHTPPELTVDPKANHYDVTFRGIDDGQLEKAHKAVASSMRSAGFEVRDLSDGVVAALNAATVDSIRDRTVEQALNTIGERINVYGVSEPLIQRQGKRGQRILVQLPGVDDPERVKKLIGKVAFLELKLVDSGPYSTRELARANYGASMPSNLEVVEGTSNTGESEYFVVERIPIVTGQDLSRADSMRDQYGQPAVGFRLNAEGARKFGLATGKNVGRRLAVILDNHVKTAPVIKSRISDSGQIENLDSADEARDLALVLRAGALPAKISYLEERTVGPTLGKESIRSGLVAALIGLIAVVVFMVIYYKLSGLNAVVALLLNMLLLLGALAALGATLTLPGIAGYILTIGMAVDANVLIFERIREDLQAGKAVRSAIDGGFAKAFWTIFDANVTTLIAALFLIQFGTGPIRGFAITLSIGIVASMFTAIFVSRTLFDAFVLRGKSPTRLSI